jgi:hypothetical protein
MTRFLLATLALILLLTGCDYATDPERIAVQIEAQGRADRMAELTQEEVADMVQARALEYQREQIAIREGEIRQTALTNVWTRVLPLLGVALVIVVLGIAFSASFVMVGASAAHSIKAITGSVRIYPDQNGNYPILPIPKQTPVMLANLNNNSVTDTEKEHKAVPQLATGDMYIRATAVLARHAAGSRDNGAEVAIIRPPLIEAPTRRPVTVLEENNAEISE